ncbi:MAG: hypothetical protein K5891_10720 [Lachnospiraceae bacterium]|nr:hypothetical protein [Lachnospiraceae bacterium]
MPVILGAVFLTMYLLFYVYDRALMDQDLGSVVFRMANEDFVTPGERVGSGVEWWEKRYFDKYYGWRDSAFLGYRYGKVTGECGGSISFPLMDLILPGRDRSLSARASYGIYPHREAAMVRLYRKLTKTAHDSKGGRYAGNGIYQEFAMQL